MNRATRRINVTFHGIGEPERELTPGERDVWITQSQFTGLLDAVRDRPDVSLSFDDGNISDLRCALPQLRRRGLRATFFVVAGRFGQPGFLSESDVRQLAAAGMRIGCHGMVHRSWRGLDPHDQREEMLVARQMLEEVVGDAVDEAACPFGAYDRRVLQALRAYGYHRVYTSDGGTSGSESWLQARTSVHSGQRNGVEAELENRARRRPETALRSAKSVIKRWR
jgi:peptidoglycan/xylan/chitin deacetylase (PgdA/CDA1 family)